jgi:hypothetical protein
MRNLTWSVALLVACPPSSVLAQCRPQSKPDKPYTLQPNQQWVNFGGQWNRWSPAERLAYLRGLVDGSSRVYLRTLDFRELTTVNRECLGNTMAVRYDHDVLIAIISDLYKDPANTYVMHSEMVFVARDKLEGKDVEAQLRIARETARAFYILN